MFQILNVRTGSAKCIYLRVKTWPLRPKLKLRITPSCTSKAILCLAINPPVRWHMPAANWLGIRQIHNKEIIKITRRKFVRADIQQRDSNKVSSTTTPQTSHSRYFRIIISKMQFAVTCATLTSKRQIRTCKLSPLEYFFNVCLFSGKHSVEINLLLYIL